jgi:hypothetical protein
VFEMAHASPETEFAAGVPLPMSTINTPAQSPFLPPSRPWLSEGFSASPEPQTLRLSAIEVVPPTPPPRTGRKKLPSNALPTRINEDGIVVMGEESASFPGTPLTAGLPTPVASPRATPRATPRNRVLGVGSRNATPTASPRVKMMNRMSKTFHSGTPPPAIRMLHPDDAKHAPISATFVRDPNNNRLSTYSNNNNQSRRQSVVSMNGTSVLHQELERQQQRQLQREREAASGSKLRMERKDTTTTSDDAHTLSPDMVPRSERSRSHSQQSHATSGGHTWQSSSSGSNGDGTAPAKMMRVDPLTLLERRRRRDFTIGSHNPLHGPPNTPAASPRRGVSMAESDLSDVPSVGWQDLMGKFKNVMRRFSDMPWVAEPCVATLVIPVGPNEKRCAGGAGGQPAIIDSWYKKKPSLDELLEAGTENEHQYPGQNGGNPEPPTGTTLATLMTPTIRDEDLDGASTTTETMTSQPTSPPMLSSPKSLQGWSPRSPEPALSAGRERFGDALVVRGLVNR